MKLIRELQGQFGSIDVDTVKRASKYIVLTGHDLTDYNMIIALELLRQNVVSGTSGDICKYSLIESYKVDLAWTINARSLQNFLQLRSSKQALWEIRNLANAIYQALPETHKYLFTESMAANELTH